MNKKLSFYLAPYQKRMALGLSIKIIGTIVELFLPLIMAYMIDYIAPTKKIWILILLGIGMLALSLIAFFGNVIANRMASKVAKDITNQIRNDLFSKTLHLSSQQIDAFSIPSLISRLSSDTYNVHQMIGMMQRLGVRAPILLIGGVLLTFTIDPILALILLISVPFLTLIVFFVSKKGIALYTNLQKSNDKMVRKVRDDYTGVRVIKALSKIEAEQKSFQNINEEIVKNAISKIQASGEILLKIINDVLDLSKIESGKAEIVEMVTDLKQMEENLKMMLEYSIQKGMIDFKVEDQIENPLVWCDATKLQQVLVNVLNNAVKFTQAGGTITFSCVQRMIAPGFAEYKFTIKDTGIGMTEEFQKHAFEAFERERTSTESKTEGTGLGLAIVKKLVDLMHGDVIIQSNSGQGTKIQISLPLRIATENQLHQSDKAKEYKIGLDGMHVLLVEDNELNAEIAMEVLKNKGILVNWVPDGCACVEEIQNKEAGTYQFILMDVQMPRMNGYEATQKIRQLADVKKAQIPIIAMTANAFEEDRKHALDAGMDGFIMKPFRVDEMMKVIGEVME